MIEEWRPVVGYEGLYEVSNTGQIRSLDRYSYRLYKGKVLRPVKCKVGYLQVNLAYNGKIHKKYVHRLVAQAFIPNPDNLPQVNHRDEDKTNNIAENLEWCDSKYNINYGARKDKVRDTAIKNGYWTGLSRKEYKKKYDQDNKEYRKEYNQKYYLKRKEQIQNNV